ncbi:MAG: Zn-ribbon domain-containing OB-fold protein [Proteobacteria bacterium]|nr:Zn-ribbon domain-containing OB-fold protein [Burkholderiales bacterium]
MPGVQGVGGADRRFKEALAAGRFDIQRCRSCGSHFFYPRVICPHCGGSEIEWVAASGRATVHSTTTVRRKAEQGGDYNVCIVELDEGPRMMSRVDGTPSDDVRIGMRVSASVAGAGDGAFVVFHVDGRDAQQEGAR